MRKLILFFVLIGAVASVQTNYDEIYIEITNEEADELRRSIHKLIEFAKTQRRKAFFSKGS